STDDEHAFPLSALNREAGNRHVTKPGVVKSIDKDAICEASCVNHGVFGARSNQGKGNSNDDVFFVSAGPNVDHVIWSGIVDGETDCFVAAAGTGGIHAEGGSGGVLFPIVLVIIAVVVILSLRGRGYRAGGIQYWGGGWTGGGWSGGGG